MPKLVSLSMFVCIVCSLSVKYVMSSPLPTMHRPSQFGSNPGRENEDSGREGGGFKTGPWRAMLERKDGHSIIFNFEVKDSAGRKILYIRNAGEHLLVDDVKIEGDSVLIRLPFFESQLRAVLTKEGNLEGVWLKRGAN